ncbi:MAG: SDR family NAD(P)-dependent oxidoreductase, partial [Planctomycetota bacterium]
EVAAETAHGPNLPPPEPEGPGAVPAPDPGAGAGEVAAEAGDAPSAVTFRRDLLAEVSRRTGFPEDMLDLALPQEARLGNDSIKVMEIFSALKPYHRYLADPTQDEEEVLAQFTRLETLGAILAHYAERRKAAPASEAPASDAPASDAPAREAPPAVRLERRVLTSVATDLPDAVDLGDEAFSILPSGLGLVLVGDVPDLSAALGTALASKGRVAWQLVPGREFRRLDAHRFEVDLDDRAGVEEAARAIRDADEADVGGFVNLLNLDPSARRPDLQDLDAPLRLARRLLHVAQAFEDDIRASVSRGGGLVLNLTGLAARFGLPGDGPLPVAQAASLGFVKSLAREWKGVRVQTLDVDPDADPSLLLAQLAQELARGDGAVEVGFDGRSRWRLDLARVPTPEPPMPIGLGSDAVVLVTGGARGIGALVTQRLAARTKATFVVVGRSPMSPETDEPEAVRGIEDVGRVREALIRSRGGGNGRRATPAEIEDEVRRVERARATRRGPASLEAAGARVEYHALDVRDAEGFGSLIDDVYARHGRIDGVIHAAGVIEDRRLADKTSESFARVFETKVRPALVLARRLRPQGLAFLVFFSSVSGRFGNAGQVDYSAANEVLNKLADDLDRSWPGRVVSINWGPWDAGMLSEGLREAYRRRGIGLIEPEAGAAAFLDELARTAPGASEVVLACDVGRIEGAGRGETPREDPAP